MGTKTIRKKTLARSMLNAEGKETFDWKDIADVFASFHEKLYTVEFYTISACSETNLGIYPFTCDELD
jgi:hypothetical protein